MVREVGQGSSWVYLVTAKHCVEKAMMRFGHLKARINQQNGPAILIDLPNHWAYSDKESSDLAVLHWPDDQALEIATIRIPKDVLPHPLRTRRILASAMIFYRRSIHSTPRHAKEHSDCANGRNRQHAGRAARGCGGMDYSAYLIEVRSIGGLSGSPVFVHIPPDRLVNSLESPKGAALLLGLIRLIGI